MLKISSNETGTIYTIYARRNIGIILFIPFFFLPWAVGAIIGLSSLKDVMDDRAIWGTLFYLVWVLWWAIVGLLVLPYFWLKEVFGTETIDITPTQITQKIYTFILPMTKIYDLDKIEDVAINEARMRVQLSCIEFSYNDKLQRIAGNTDKENAQTIVAQITKTKLEKSTRTECNNSTTAS